MRRFLPIAIVLLVALAAAMASGSPDQRRSGPTGDPRSTTDAGARAAVLLIESAGREVHTGGFGPQVEVVVLTHDLVAESDARDVEDWVNQGGQLVLLGNGLGFGPASSGVGRITSDDTCDRLGYDGIDAPEVGLGPSIEGSPTSACFAVGDGWFVSVAAVGDGLVVATSSPRPFLNSSLATGDHAGLLLALLDETTGPVLILEVSGNGIGDGDQSLADLVPEAVWASLFALGVAWLLFMMQRGRRLGRPIAEGHVVQIDGFEVVRATARLYNKAGARQLGIDRLRAELVGDLNRRWMGRGDALTEVLVTTDQAARFAKLLRLDDEATATLELALTGQVLDDDSFVAVAAALVRARVISTGSAHPTRVKMETR